MISLNRGDIVLVNFNPAKGGEIGKLRPAIVLSDKDDNEILDTVIVIPLSTVIEEEALPYRFLISDPAEARTQDPSDKISECSTSWATE